MSTTTFDDTTGLARPSIGSRLSNLPKRALIVGGAAIVLALAGAGWIAWPASSVSTDDAYIKADSTIVAPKVQGLIARVLVRDNKQVKAGQPLIEIDPEELELLRGLTSAAGSAYHVAELHAELVRLRDENAALRSA